MVAGGAGVTLLPELAVATETGRAPLVVRRFTERAPNRTIGLGVAARLAARRYPPPRGGDDQGHLSAPGSSGGPGPRRAAEKRRYGRRPKTVSWVDPVTNTLPLAISAVLYFAAMPMLSREPFSLLPYSTLFRLVAS